MDKDADRSDIEQANVRIRRIMKRQELTAYALAKLMKGSFSSNEAYLSRMFNGKANPNLETYHAIANALKVPVEEILGKEFWKKY